MITAVLFPMLLLFSLRAISTDHTVVQLTAG